MTSDPWADIWRIAGSLGKDFHEVEHLTLRQLNWMVEGRNSFAWSIASSIMALIANINRDPKRRRKPFDASDFNPCVTKKRRSSIAVTEENKNEFRDTFSFLRKK